jgi:hypothetical protein
MHKLSSIEHLTNDASGIVSNERESLALKGLTPISNVKKYAKMF